MSAERVFAFINRGLEVLKRGRSVVLHLKSLLNAEPNPAFPARTPFLGEAIEGHPNRLDGEVALKNAFGVGSDRSGFRTLRGRRFQALEHDLAKGSPKQPISADGAPL